jgi:hypothetical protein
MYGKISIYFCELEVKDMVYFFLKNNILNRLPLSLSGITNADFGLKGQVYPKLNIMLKRKAVSLP